MIGHVLGVAFMKMNGHGLGTVRFFFLVCTESLKSIMPSEFSYHHHN